MRICPACGYRNPDDLDICLDCAAELGASCPACGQLAPAGSLFCSQCGARLASDRTPAADSSEHDQALQSLRALMPKSLAKKIDAARAGILGERREVTVVFADVSNFTAAVHNLDSEDVYTLIDRAMRLLVEVVYKYEGAVDKFTGDGLMALFGAPVAHENDPERAVRAALEILNVLQPLREHVQQEYGFDFQVRIGIHTGVVVAGGVGNDLHMEYTVIGDTVNLASRLQTAAEPGTILVSLETQQRTQPLFKFKTMPPLTVKGMPDPIQVFRALSQKAQTGRLRGLPDLKVPMIGREDALERLRGSLGKIRQEPCGQIVLITGEAGVGKSRLVAEFRATLPQSDVSIYEGGCLAYARSRPLWIVAELLRDILRFVDTDPIDVRREKLQAGLKQLGLQNDEVQPYLLQLLGLPQGDPRIEARLRLLDASMLQKQTHAALRQVFLAEARLAPTVLIFEDLHWIDPASSDFLEYLIQACDDDSLLLILVARDSERKTVIQPLIATLEKYPERLVDIPLQALSEAEGELLVNQLLRPSGAEPAIVKLKRQIAKRAQGNPFFAEEIIRMLIDQGALTRPSGQAAWQVMPRARELLQEVPGTVKGLVLARFDRLPEALRRTLQKATVLGNSFPAGLLHLLNGVNPETLNAQLFELEARGFLVAESFGSQPGYAFRHILVQEGVYATLLKRDRQKLHELAGHAVEHSAFWLPDEKNEALAFHYAESANPARATPFLLIAAEEAARRYAHETAIQHYRRAMSLMAKRPAGRGDEFYRVRIGLGQALKFVGEFAEARQVLREALHALSGQSASYESGLRSPIFVEILRELADVCLREGALDEATTHLQAGLKTLGPANDQGGASLRRSLMDRMAWVQFRRGNFDETLDLVNSATAGIDPERTDDPTTLASLYNTLGGVFWQQGNLSQAVAYVERSLSLYENLGYAWGMATAYTNLGVLYYGRGMWPKAAESFERSDSLRREIGYVAGQGVNLKNLGLLRLAMGDHARAEKDLAASLAISRRLGDDFGIVCAEIGLGQLAITRSQVDEAMAHVQAALALSAAAGEDEAIQAHWLLALIRAEKGDLQAGQESAAHALQMAHKTGIAESEADCIRVQGILKTRAGDYLEAEALLRESVELCRRHNDLYRQGLALLELGRMYQRLAHVSNPAWAEWRVKALAAFQEAVEHFELLGAAYDLEMAQASLSQVIAGEVMAHGPLPPSDAGQTGPAGPSPAVNPAVAEGERHRAAIVWLSLGLPRGTDDEAVFETLSLAIPHLMAIAHEYEGQVLRRQDGLTVAFGVPAAHEDDAERAVQAVWHMLSHLQKTSQPAQVPLTVRLAVSQGQVVAGQIRHPSHTEYVVTGEPVQQAQRVAEHAPPGKVWVSQTVRAATDHMAVFEPAPASVVAHLGDLSISELVGLRQAPGAARGLPGIKGRLVGRETPLKAMVDLSQNLRQGTGGLIWIEGEAGIGKSRLMKEFTAALAETGVAAWAGRCAPQRSTQAFSLFSNLLAQVFNLQTADTPDQISARIQQTLQAWPAEAQMTRPYLELLSGVKPTGLEGERLSSLEPDQLRQQVFVALRSLFKSLATQQPLLIVLDDLHWIDSLSAELLLFLSHMVAAIPILFIGARRWEESETPDQHLVKVRQLHPTRTVRLFLNRLSLGESEALLSELVPQAELPVALRTTILQRSEGNPYYLEEFVRVLIEQGYLRHGQGGWEADGRLEPKDLPLPSSLEALIHSRVDALPAELKQVLQCAAVIGNPFEVDLLKSTSGLPDIQPALIRLESRAMLRRTAKADQWQFSHSLIEAAVYNSLFKARRRALHLRVAQVLEARWEGAKGEHAEELAYHFTRAERGAEALVYLVLAGERAVARYANEEALVYLQQAAQQLATQTEASDDLRWRIAIGLGEVYRFVGEYAQSTAALEAVLPLMASEQLSPESRAGLHRRLGETAQKKGEIEAAREHFTTALSILNNLSGDPALVEAAHVFIGLAWTHFVQGSFDLAKQACETSLEYARRADSVRELATAENMLGGIFYRTSEWDAAMYQTNRAMDLRAQMGYTWGVAASSSNLGILAVLAGDWNQAKSYFQKSLALRQELGDTEGVAIVHNNLGSLARDQGELDLAERHFRESLATATPLKMVYHVAHSTLGLAQVLLLQGKTESAQEAVTDSLAQAATIGAQDVLAEIHRVQAEIWLAQSAWDRAKEAAERSASLASETGNRSLEAAARRVASEIELQQGNLPAARAALAQARLAFANVTDEMEAGRVAAQAGRLSLREGDAEQAEKNLRIAEEIFFVLGASLDLKLVEQALNRPSAPPAVPAGPQD